LIFPSVGSEFSENIESLITSEVTEHTEVIECSEVSIHGSLGVGEGMCMPVNIRYIQY